MHLDKSLEIKFGLEPEPPSTSTVTSTKCRTSGEQKTRVFPIYLVGLKVVNFDYNER